MDKDKNFCFRIEMEVRDYELDCEQIVNNAIYLHYMEHTRHQFCKYAGLPFIEMHKNGIDAVVRKIEIEYFSPLMSGDKFISGIKIERKGPRYIFYQDLIKTTGEQVAKGVVSVVILKDGKISRGDEIAGIFERFL